MPVLPLVGSMIVVFGLIRPCFSASAIMLQHMRSFTLPPGLRASSLPKMMAFASFAILFSRTSGVLPIVSKTLFAIFAIGFYLLGVKLII
jgi:hypothetical protein